LVSRQSKKPCPLIDWFRIQLLELSIFFRYRAFICVHYQYAVRNLKLRSDIKNNITEKLNANPLGNSGIGIMPFVRHLAIPVILETGRA
jgi:hypothetical protein